ncbi:23S rRNA (uracil(1939)-C(5))-methyltransferase RlmD [Amphritea balenae]|nr:23S rRNA (uracil(1939)-C(5))-methyltransferase RlmD [Amphritea balenae]
MKPNRSRNQKQRPLKRQSETLPAEAIELTIDSLSHDARGIGRYQGKTVFITDALPGEQVLARLTEEKAKFYTGQTLEVLTPDSHRISPNCPHYDQCGGCDMQHIDNAYQLELKQAQVLDQISRIGNSKPANIQPALTATNWNYRRSARIGINQLSDGEPIIGFRRSGSNLLSQIDSCAVLDKRVSDIFSRIREDLTDTGDIRHITQMEIDLGDNNGYLALRLKKALNEEHLSIFQAAANDYLLTLDLQLIGEESAANKPQPASYVLNELTLEFQPSDFIQVNPEINQQMVNKAIELLQPAEGDQILDLFCGLGNFSLPVAKSGVSVTGIEGSMSMVHRAEHNAELNQLTSCNFYCANLAEPLNGHQWYKQPYNKIILDPPRAGAAEILPQVTALKPEKILYISCNPGALARDSRILTEEGYIMQEFMVMDMFPQTHHIESMVLFTRGKKKKQKKKLFSGKGISR